MGKIIGTLVAVVVLVVVIYPFAQEAYHRYLAVSYTHLTLPTILRV